MEGMYFDGVPVCDDCGGGLCQARLPECNNLDHRDFDLVPLLTLSDFSYSQSVEHHSVPCMMVGDYPYAQCACGEIFKHHGELKEHMSEKNPPPKGDVEHVWHTIYSGDGLYYDCRCGEHFDTHEELMQHTAELNPKLDTLTMGRAGAAMERESHIKTLDLLRRARDILLMTDDVADKNIITLLEDIAKQCPVLAEEDE